MPAAKQDKLEDDQKKETVKLNVDDKAEAKVDVNQHKPKSKKSLKNFRYWNVVDSILFLLIVLAVSFTMVLTGLAEEPEDIAKFEATEEYPEQAVRAFLTGTVPRVNYTDTGGRDTVYADYSVKKLLIEDIRIRHDLGPYKAPANEQSLNRGIESELRLLADNLVGPGRTYVLNVKLNGLNEEFSEESVITILGSDISKISSESGYISEGTEVVIIYDPGRIEVGEFEMIVEFRIYRI